ncbi:hypothetical protein VW35_06120 [Devosia soli]|uniref:Uncharacterized protein n=1 Tax=Devosia soli TaxID=361041 RepID=A0A0F5LCD5_9HYPH|nr:hypothetical protein [Devosia soli]KKB80026.1 hypothetical protein VW35_06120 [Devosia soli]
MTVSASDTAARNAEFKQRFAAVLGDIQKSGAEDGEAMALIGSLAADLADTMQQLTWTAAKSNMTPQVYNDLLKVFEQRGNEYHQAGKTKHAYAIQALAMSLVAATLRSDPQMAAGEKMLDAVIDRSVSVYRTQSAKSRH